MGYNVLSGSVSSTSVISSGSFIGDGAGLENVKQFELFNEAVALIPFYKTHEGDYALDSNSGFNFQNGALAVPALTSSSGIKLSNPISGTLAGVGSFLGIDSSGNMVITSSAAGAGPVNSLQFNTGGGEISGSSVVTLVGTELRITGSIAITGSIYPSGSAIYDLGSPTRRWNELYLGTGSVHLGPNCKIETSEASGTIIVNKPFSIEGGLILSSSSYINWGITTGSSGYGFRDNSGALQFKNNGGSWGNVSDVGIGSSNAIQFHSGSGVLSGSDNLTFDGSTLNLSGTMTITGSIYPSGSAIYSLGSPTNRWDSIHVGTGSVHLGEHCTISTSEPVGGHHSITLNKWTEISGSGSSGEGLTVTGSLLPGADSLYDLGSPTKQWRSLYVSSSTVYFGGEALSVAEGSLKFGSGSATKGFHIGHMHLLDRGIVMDPNRIFQMKAFQMQFHGGVAYKRKVVSWDYQVLKTDYMIGVQSDTLTASVKLTLPDATACIAGQTFIFKDEGGNCHTHNIVISASNGDQIDGNGIITLESPYSSVNIYTNGDNKYFIY